MLFLNWAKFRRSLTSELTYTLCETGTTNNTKTSGKRKGKKANTK